MPRKYSVVSPDYVRKNYSYNEATGEFKNLRTGHIYYTDTEYNQSVYKRVKIKGHLFQLHILIYAWMTNQWPKGEVCFLRGVGYEWSNLVELSKEEAGRRNAYIQVSGAKELMCGGNFDMLHTRVSYNPKTGEFQYAVEDLEVWNDPEKAFFMSKGADATIAKPNSKYRNVRYMMTGFIYPDVAAWTLFYGDPNPDLERIDGDPENNRIDNFRDRITGQIGNPNDIPFKHESCNSDNHPDGATAAKNYIREMTPDTYWDILEEIHERSYIRPELDKHIKALDKRRNSYGGSAYPTYSEDPMKFTLIELSTGFGPKKYVKAWFDNGFDKEEFLDCMDKAWSLHKHPDEEYLSGGGFHRETGERYRISSKN